MGELSSVIMSAETVLTYVRSGEGSLFVAKKLFVVHDNDTLLRKFAVTISQLEEMFDLIRSCLLYYVHVTSENVTGFVLTRRNIHFWHMLRRMSDAFPYCRVP